MNPYFSARAVLLSHQILVQSITVEKINWLDNKFQWVLDSIAVQSYAKLGGAPWVIAAEESESEIVMGIAEARLFNRGDDGRFFGFASTFNQNGAYLWTKFSEPVEGFDEYKQSLAERLRSNVEDYRLSEGREPKRVVVHLYKPPGRRTEVKAVEQALIEAGLDMDYAILHIDHKTDFRLFDLVDPDKKPGGRLVVKLDDYTRLVVLSGREIHWIPPRVALIRLARQSTYRDLNRLTQQVYNFTLTNWSGFQQNNVPVTIKYPYMLARKYADLTEFGGDWYGHITGTFLRDKVWFI
jgi:argonaute-like protein implicated in RNA metabolism and viral defense